MGIPAPYRETFTRYRSEQSSRGSAVDNNLPPFSLRFFRYLPLIQRCVRASRANVECKSQVFAVSNRGFRDSNLMRSCPPFVLGLFVTTEFREVDLDGFRSVNTPNPETPPLMMPRDFRIE